MIRVCNWEKWQTYRRDRNPPPWIKVHRRLLQDPEYAQLTDAQRGQLVGMWLLAADRDGWLPEDPKVIKRLCMMTKEPDLEVFARLGFIARDANMASTCRQHDAPEAEAEAEAEAEILLSSSELWEIWLKELGGNGTQARLTATRSEKLTALAKEHRLEGEAGIQLFQKVLRAVKRSEFHMSKREYQMPESLFRNAERRDTWIDKARSDSPKPRGFLDSFPAEEKPLW